MTTKRKAVILDLDGTVYLGDQLIPGAGETIATLRDRGLEVLFLTNKAIERRGDYSTKLEKLGVPASRDDVLNSGWVTSRYAARNYPDRRAFVVGEEPLLAELEAAGIEVGSEEPFELLIVSMDRNFTYQKLETALRTLERGAPFLATNPDRTCPMESGMIPDAAGMIGAIEGVSGEDVDAMLGKPSTTMVETVLAELDAEPEECIMIGDRLETDIRMGNRAGMTTMLVLSGVTDRSMLRERDIIPDHVLGSIAELDDILR